jgi:hypothetical protein
VQGTQKPGFPLQVLEIANAISAGFPLQSLARKKSPEQRHPAFFKPGTAAPRLRGFVMAVR